MGCKLKCKVKAFNLVAFEKAVFLKKCSGWHEEKSYKNLFRRRICILTKKVSNGRDQHSK